MTFSFAIDGRAATLERNWFTGKISLVVDGATKELADPLNPSTHFSSKLTKTWIVETLGHEITIEKIRPLILAGFRRQTFRVFVDGQVLAEKTGY